MRFIPFLLWNIYMSILWLQSPIIIIMHMTSEMLEKCPLRIPKRPTNLLLFEAE